ncbi:MAG: hypothetical protein ACR2GL_00905, partial [Thermoleophilaceae bacterium]
VDQSLQTLMQRIDELEARLAGASSPEPADGRAAARPGPAPRVAEDAGDNLPAPRAERPEPGAGAALGQPVSTRVAQPAATSQPAPTSPVAAGGLASAAVAPQPEPAVAAPQPEPAVAAPQALDLDRVKGLWPAVAGAVAEQNAMVAALFAEAGPTALEGDRLTVGFPPHAAFSKKKAEANRELLSAALRTLTGRGLAVVFELSGGRAEPAPARLGEEELLARLKQDFGAEELPADDDPDTED